MNTKINTVIEALKQALHVWEDGDDGLVKMYIGQALALLRSLPEQGEGPYTVGPNDGFGNYPINGLPFRVGPYRTEEAAQFACNNYNAVYQAGRLSAGLAHPTQVGPEEKGEGDRHKNGAGLSASMSPKTETISAAIPVANSPELPFDDDAKCQSAAIAHLPNGSLPEIMSYALGVHTHARPLAYTIWRMASEASRIERIRWGHDGDCGADRIAEGIVELAEQSGVKLEE